MVYKLAGRTQKPATFEKSPGSCMQEAERREFGHEKCKVGCCTAEQPDSALCVHVRVGAPNAIHYAWDAKVPGHDWSFNKHDYKDIVAETCDIEHGRRGLFPHPPWPSQLQVKVEALFPV